MQLLSRFDAGSDSMRVPVQCKMNRESAEKSADLQKKSANLQTE
jgi:hypothetical protein